MKTAVLCLTVFMQLSCTAVALAQSATVPAASAPAAGAPSVSASPERTTATFADWTLRCERPALPAGAARVCEIAQTIQFQGQQTPIAQIAIGRVQRTDPQKITLVLPSNVMLTSPPRFATEEKDGQLIDTVWQRCLPGGCFADALLRDDVARRMRAGTEQGRIEFRDASGREVKLPFSLRGFAQAMDALAKE